MADIVALIRKMNPDVASYLSWVALLAVEARRVMRRTILELQEV